MKLSEEKISELRDSMEYNLTTSFVDKYDDWKESLTIINNRITQQIKRDLIISSFDSSLLYTYDELCCSILNKIKVIPIKSLDSDLISDEITQEITDEKLLVIIKNHLNQYEFKLN